MTTVTIKSGDTAIDFTSTLSITGDDDWNLVGASVKFLLRSGTMRYSFAADIVSDSLRTVAYSPGPGFPTSPGTYSQEWEVTFTDGTKLTFPSTGVNCLKILPDLN